MRKRISLAQTLVLDPDIILMDEPFSALDIQTRQLMENEVLDLWADEEARRCSSSPTTSTRRSRMSDRVVVLSAGPGVAPDRRVRDRPAAAARRRRGARRRRASSSCTQAIWAVLRDEVLKGYRAAARGMTEWPR